ncbi:MAG TPA: hypothetical protein VMT74_01195 [Gaiellaceae bacterium]|nr:hypothetical protein [Gaiellaceae bacterium]
MLLGKREEEEPGRMKHHVVRGIESLAVLSLVAVPIVRRIRARRRPKRRVLEIRRTVRFGH